MVGILPRNLDQIGLMFILLFGQKYLEVSMVEEFYFQFQAIQKNLFY